MEWLVANARFKVDGDIMPIVNIERQIFMLYVHQLHFPRSLHAMAGRSTPQASSQVAGSPGKVVEQVTHASSIPVRNGGVYIPTAIESMAPPPMHSSGDNSIEPISSSSSTGPMTTHSNSSFAISPMTSSRISDKVCTHVEKSPIHHPVRPPIDGKSTKDLSPLATLSRTSVTSSATAAVDALSSTVESLIDAAESRVLAREASSVAHGAPSPSDGRGGRAFETAALHGGPFSASELGRLSLHCVPVTLADIDGGTSRMSKMGAWCAIDADVLSTLTPLLRSHVMSALGVDLVGEGRGVITRSIETDASEDTNGGKRGKRPVIMINQVSVEYICRLY